MEKFLVKSEMQKCNNCAQTHSLRVKRISLWGRADKIVRHAHTGCCDIPRRLNYPAGNQALCGCYAFVGGVAELIYIVMCRSRLRAVKVLHILALGLYNTAQQQPAAAPFDYVCVVVCELTNYALLLGGSRLPSMFILLPICTQKLHALSKSRERWESQSRSQIYLILGCTPFYLL